LQDGLRNHLVALVDKLMSACNKLKAIDMIELCSDFVAKQPSSPARRNGPSPYIFWITPHKIAKRAFVRNFLSASNDTNLVECANLRTQPTVNAKDFAINDSTKDKEIEDLAASLPN